MEIEDSASAKKELDRLEEEMEAFLVKFEALQAPDMRVIYLFKTQFLCFVMELIFQQARDKLREVSEKFNEVNEEYRDVALMTKRLRKAFNEVKQQRLQLFKACFDHVCEQIDGIYKASVETKMMDLVGLMLCFLTGIDGQPVSPGLSRD